MDRHSLLFALAVCLAFAAPQAAKAQPSNDNFASAITIGNSSTPYTNSQNTSSATQEPAEQIDFCGGQGESIWYRYTPSATGTVIADTTGSSFDTVLTVFTGSSLANLVGVACNDDWNGLLTYLPFRVQAGTTYYIRLNGYSGSSGSATFHLSSRVQPQFTECPVIGKTQGCEYQITAESDGDIAFARDLNQAAYTNFTAYGRLMGVRNQSGAPLCAVRVNALNAFRFDETTIPLGICGEDVFPNPAMCPFGETLHEGPGVTFERVTNNYGVVRFDPCIANNGTGYFSVPGSSLATGFLYTCAEDDQCGPDSDSDGIINDLDNCPSNANPDQANLDGDAQGDICDPVDNQLVLRSASVKQKSTGRLFVIKGSIFQSETVMDTPDASEGFTVYVDDTYTTGYLIDLPAEACVTEATKITCEIESETSSTTFQIKTSGISRGKAPFTLKHVGPELEAPVGGFPGGPINMMVFEPVSNLVRSGQAVECRPSESKIICK